MSSIAPPPAVHDAAGDDASVLGALRSPARLGTELLAGLVVALALIPEAISFSVLVGVDPRVGLYASFTMAVTIAVTGGRRAMISAATAAVALVVAPVYQSHGYDYLLATVLLAGVMQILMAGLGVARLLRFIPRSVMVGFINALALFVLLAQIQEFDGADRWFFGLVIAGLVLLVVIPRYQQAVPAPLIVIVVLTAVSVWAGWEVVTVGDKGALPDRLPMLVIPTVPLRWATVEIIAPVAFTAALVGLLESLMTAKLVDDLTDSHSDKTREAWGQGVANIVTALFGGMGGCAVIGQTMMNVKVARARTRLSTFSAGLFLLVFVLLLGDIVARIPMAALVAVMIIVAANTVDWHSVHPRTLRRMPLSATTIMVVTMGVTVLSNNLAYGVISGVITAMVFFARRVARFTEVVAHDGIDEISGTPRRIYAVQGVLFFASSNDLVYQFDYVNDPDQVTIDLTAAQIYDASTVAALDAIIAKYAQRGKQAEIVGLNPASAQWHALSGHLKATP